MESKMKKLILAITCIAFFCCNTAALAKIATFKIVGNVTDIYDDGYLAKNYKNIQIGSKITSFVRYDTNAKYYFHGEGEDWEDPWYFYKIRNELLITVDKYTIAHAHKYEIRYSPEFVYGSGAWMAFLYDDKSINLMSHSFDPPSPSYWSDRVYETITMDAIPDSYFHFRWKDGNTYREVRGDVTQVIPLKTYTTARFLAPLKKNPLVVERKSRKVIPIKVVLHDEKGKPITNKSLAVPPVVQVFKQGSGGDVGKFVQACSLLRVKGTPANRMTYKGNGVWTYMLNTSKYPDPGTYNIKVLTGNRNKYIVDQPFKAQFRRK
jgi:hypothetical protein